MQKGEAHYRNVLPQGCIHLFNCYGFGKVPRLVDITTSRNGRIIREQLQGNDRQNRDQEFVRSGHLDDMVHILGKFRVVGSGNADAPFHWAFSV